MYALNFGAPEGDVTKGRAPIPSSAKEMAAFVDRVLAASGTAEADMLAWAVNGIVPPAFAGRLPLARRGPVAVAPALAAADRVMFFNRLRGTTEAAARQGESGVLLVLARRGWSPHWAEARSTAAALARLGTRSRCWTSSTAPWPTTTSPGPRT
ncbi:hypothetical protein ACIRD4_34690 [Streptomyces clavifer]